VLRTAARRMLLSEFDQDATDSSILVRRFFRVEAAEYPTVESALTDLVADVVFTDRALRFIQPDGGLFSPQAIVSTPAKAGRLVTPLSLLPPTRTLTVPLDPNRAPGWSLRIESSAADLERRLNGVDRLFLSGALLMTALSGAFGWTLAGRLLQPVHAMAGAAERITAADPSARLPVGSAQDELGRLGRSFNALLVRLDGALSQQRDFLANAAHELRTPIARMTSLAELSLSSPPVEEEAGRSLALIVSDLRHTGRLLDELLQLARADAGERMQRRERVFLDDVVVDAVHAWRPAAERGGVSLGIGDVQEAAIRIDPMFARRLVDILVENAIRYTPSGGRVAAAVSADGRTAMLTVSDSGIGVPPEDLPHLFRRFFRGKASRTMAPEGSGLGLPIAAWIVEQCGGTIELAARAAGGTCARVSLPVDRGTPSCA